MGRAFTLYWGRVGHVAPQSDGLGGDGSLGLAPGAPMAIAVLWMRDTDALAGERCQRV